MVTDSKDPLSPGALCREFMTSVCEDPSKTQVVMGSASGDQIIECPLSALWPHPYVYRLQNRSTLIAFAEQYSCERGLSRSSAKISKRSEDFLLYSLVHQRAMDCLEMERFDPIHPLKLAAAALFSDGSVETAWQLKGLEYGCTLDPVSQLLGLMEKRRVLGGPCHSCLSCLKCRFTFPCEAETDHPVLDESSIHKEMLPVVVVMTDQFGVCHAPFAQARSLLCEHGYSSVKVLIHSDGGELLAIPAQDLLPQAPGGAKFVSHDEFGLA